MIISTLISCFSLLLVAFMFFVFKKRDIGSSKIDERERNLYEMRESILNQQIRLDEHQLNNLKVLQDSLHKAFFEVRQQLAETMNNNTEQLTKSIERLINEANIRLKEISGQVEKRLSEGFEKTTATFSDVIKRLALIDEAQKKITELSSNVVSLQEILNDKRSRGAFGEVQLTALIRNVLPENSFEFQYTLSNDRRADAILFLPEPTGNVVIDAKFPLENYRRLSDIKLAESDRKLAENQFRVDVKKHIQDIAQKYIISGETSEGAVMFIPAEAVFAEIHAHYADLVEYAQKMRVWIVSPTTMMAILTTTRAVLKDAATRKQINIIQEHLIMLSRDFDRFQKRIDNLARHIEQAHVDVEQVHQSSQKITKRFQKIEKVDLGLEKPSLSLEEEII